MNSIRFLISVSFGIFLLGCAEKEATQKRRSIETDTFDLHVFSHAEEPYLAMTRTVQLLNLEQIVGWSLAHIERGEYEVYIEGDKRKTFLSGGSIRPSDSCFLYLKYALEGEEIRLYELSNSVSAFVTIPSDFTSAGRFNLDPILSRDGKYVLCETYDKSGRIVLYLSDINQAAPSDKPEE